MPDRGRRRTHVGQGEVILDPIGAGVAETVACVVAPARPQPHRLPTFVRSRGPRFADELADITASHVEALIARQVYVHDTQAIASVGQHHRHPGPPCLPASRHMRHADPMFIVTEADVAAIRAAFEQDGEFSAAIELRRRFAGLTDNAAARMWARTIAGWRPLPAVTNGPAPPSATGATDPA